MDLKSLRESLTIEELETLRNTCRDIREKLVVEFLCSTGCRVSEALNIRVSKIDWTDRSILVHGKGDKDRYVYFSVKCKLLLKQYLAERKGCISDYLFISDRAPYQRLTKSGMEKAIKRIAQRTTITKSVSPHVLRHTFATIALARRDVVRAHSAAPRAQQHCHDADLRRDFTARRTCRVRTIYRGMTAGQ